MKVNNGRKAAFLNLFKSNFFKTHPLLKSHILLYSNGVAILSGSHDIPQYEACRGEQWSIGGHFEFYRPEIFEDASSPETLQFVL